MFGLLTVFFITERFGLCVEGVDPAEAGPTLLFSALQHPILIYFRDCLFCQKKCLIMQYSGALHLRSLRQTFIYKYCGALHLFIRCKAAELQDICSRKTFKNLSLGAEHRNIYFQS
jgi:hypothetical protein